MYRQNIETLDDLALYLREGIGNRQRAINDLDAAVPPSETRAAELRGAIQAFKKVLQILDDQFNVESARGHW